MNQQQIALNVKRYALRNIPTTKDGIKIIHVYGTLYDVFFPKFDLLNPRASWSDWTRVSVKKGRIWIVAGTLRDVQVFVGLPFPRSGNASKEG